jgi:hypothetical protein
MSESPTRRALLIGAPVGKLRGVERDVARMEEVLTTRGFECRTRVGHAATRDEILDALRALEVSANNTTAALIYFSGHGGQWSVVDESTTFHATRYEYIVPADYRDERASDVIMLSEFYVMIDRIASRAESVTVILDCCHSVMAPRPAERVRALPSQVLARSRVPRSWLDLMQAPVVRPTWVDLRATGRGMPAFEADIEGGPAGYFTWALCGSLADPRGASRSWAQIVQTIRAQIYEHRGSRTQRPEWLAPCVYPPLMPPQPRWAFVPAMPSHAADDFGALPDPFEPPDEMELFAGASRAIAAAIERAHERGLATTHLIGKNLVQILPDGSERPLAPES